MLKLTRKVGQSICLFDENGKLMFTVSIEDMKQGQVSVGIKNDPKVTSVKRKELVEDESNN